MVDNVLRHDAIKSGNTEGFDGMLGQVDRVYPKIHTLKYKWSSDTRKLQSRVEKKKEATGNIIEQTKQRE